MKKCIRVLTVLMVLCMLLTVAGAKEVEKTWLLQTPELSVTLPDNLKVEIWDDGDLEDLLAGDGICMAFSDPSLDFEKSKKMFLGTVTVQETQLDQGIINFSHFYEDEALAMEQTMRALYGFLGINGSAIKFDSFENKQTDYLKTTVQYKIDGVTVTDTTYAAAENGLTYLFRFTTAGVNKNAVVKKIMDQVLLEPTSYTTTDFVDVAGHWSQKANETAVEKDLFAGTSAIHFSPDEPMTRAMLVQVLYRMEGEPEIKERPEFSDVTIDNWFADAVAWAGNNAIVQGYDGAFNPDGKVTREQLAAILWRYAKYQKRDVSIGENTNILSYEDAFDIVGYAIPAFQWTCGAGLMSGVDISHLAPQNLTTRAEVATILVRYLEKK